MNFSDSAPADVQPVPSGSTITPAETMATAAGPRRRPYPTDLTDLQWRRVQPLLTAQTRARGRPRATSLREVLSALEYRRRTGCPWRMLPHDFPPWETVYAYYRHWRRSGLWKGLRTRLGDRLDDGE